MIQAQWFWTIVKRKRQLLHEDIQSVLKFDFVANFFNLKNQNWFSMLLILFWLRTINLIPFQIHIEQNIILKQCSIVNIFKKNFIHYLGSIHS